MSSGWASPWNVIPFLFSALSLLVGWQEGHPACKKWVFNAEKTEAIWFGSRGNLKKLANYDCSLRVGSETIQPSTFVRDLGVYLDAELTMKQHVSKVATAFFYHLHRLCQICHRVGTLSHRPARACTHHLQTGLLQLCVSWRATVCTAACPVCSRASFGSMPCAEVRHTAITHEVWWACLQPRRSSHVELTSYRHPVELCTSQP